MSYRTELIQRLQANGDWDQLSDKERKQYEKLTDDQARQVMVLADEWEMGNNEAVETVCLASLERMFAAFKGALVEYHGENKGKLSETGRMLAEFFLALRQRGLSPDDVEAGLQELTPLVISALITVHKGPSR